MLCWNQFIWYNGQIGYDQEAKHIKCSWIWSELVSFCNVNLLNNHKVQLDLDNCTVTNCVYLENCVISWMTNFLLNKNRQKLRYSNIFEYFGTPKIASWYFGPNFIKKDEISMILMPKDPFWRHNWRLCDWNLNIGSEFPSNVTKF